MPKLVMLKTAAGPDGVYQAGRAYVVNPDIHAQFCGGDHPAALDYSEAEEIAVESGGEVPEVQESKPPPRKASKARSKTRARKG
jgi:hypothetical protein